MNVCSTDNVDLSDLSPESALGEVIARSGEVCVVDGRLRLRGPAEALDGPITARLRHHRDEVLRILNGRRAVPLSSVQRRLWFLQHLDPSGLGYTFSYAFRLHGRLHPPTLHESLSAVISAHCGLRAGFADMSGTTVQFITDVHPEMTIREAIGADSQRAEQLLRDELIQPFDPARPPLLRVALIRTGKQDWLWGLSVHHLIADGWTCALLLRDLSRAYAGLDPVVAEADYADFVAHDHTRADDSRRLAALEYWGEWLTGLPECEFPLDHPRPTLRTYRGALVTARLNASTMQRLNDLARTERTTPFAVLLSVHAATVAKHTGEDLTVVGTPHANRPSARFHDTAGCFVSTVVLPVDLSGELTFRELVHAVGSSCATAWDHSDFSYEQLVERLAPVRDISRNPLFQNFFAVQDVPTRLDLPGVSVEPMVFDDGITQFDLETHITPASDGSAELRLRYNTDLFDAVTMEGFAQRWQGMAEQLAGEPDRGVHAVSALTDADRATIASANRTDRPDPERWDLDGLFAVQVARVPDHLAVRCDGHTLTYRELDTRIEDLAAVLVQAVPAGARVGILLPRTTDLVAVVLATMRAGACFVPLPPDLPSERLTEVIGRVGLAAIWTSAGTVIEQLPGLLQLHPEDTPPNGPARRKRANDGCQPAYIMHTSGSTGVPKGVEIPDRALVNLLLSIRETPGLQACDVLVAVTNLFFDIALLELLLPLITGASVVIATDDESRDPALLRDLLQRSAATVLQATPSMWRILLDTGWTGQRGMRAWCGGEPLSRDLADRLLSGCEQVWNLYGPTESTIWSACWRVESTGPILVGAPIANTPLHILDRHGVP
ncbi:MAG: AMP-binding protein, partial [Mycobacterium sp.]|nr:AMP-binding protein [Mycobacterium sp.]